MASESWTTIPAGGGGVNPEISGGTLSGTTTLEGTINLDAAATIDLSAGTLTLGNDQIPLARVDLSDSDTLTGALTVTGTVDVSGGTLTLANDQISGDKVSGGTIDSATLDNTNTVTVTDASFTLQDDGDNTKQVSFQLSGITTGTTRTLTVPDLNGTFQFIDANQTITATHTYTGTLDVSGGTLTVANDQISGDAINGGTATPATLNASTDVQVGGVSALTDNDLASNGGDLAEESGNNTFAGNNSFTGDLDHDATTATKVAAGTTAQRPGTPEAGDIRWNSTTTQYEAWNPSTSTWGPLGGAGYFQGENGARGDIVNGKGDIFRVNEAILNTDVTIASGDNASCAGPLEVATGTTLTVNGVLVIV